MIRPTKGGRRVSSKRDSSVTEMDDEVAATKKAKMGGSTDDVMETDSQMTMEKHRAGTNELMEAEDLAQTN